MITNSTEMRQLTLIAFTLVVAFLIGGLIGGVPTTGFVLVGGGIVVTLVVISLSSPNNALLILFMVFIFIGVIRRTIEFMTGFWHPATLILIDISLGLTLASIAIPILTKRGAGNTWNTPLEFPSVIRVPVTLFGGWVLISLLNPNVFNITMSLVGFRQYLFPVTSLFLGWYFVHNWQTQEWNRAGRIALWTSVIVVLFSMVQLALDQLPVEGVFGALLSPGGGDTAAHSWTPGEFIDLKTSFFSTSKRYGRYLIMIYPFVWAHINNRRQTGLHWFAFSFFMLGAIISGAREAVALLVLEELILGGVIIGTLRQGLALVLIFLLLIPVLSNEDIVTRLEFSASRRADWETRISRMVIGPFALEEMNISTQEFWLGIGAGKHGSGNMLFESSDPELERFKVTSEGETFDAVDSGLYKIQVELGLIGVVLFVYLVGALLWVINPWRSIIRNNFYCQAASVGIMAWLILFFKGHSTITDLMLWTFFWGYVAIIFSEYHKQRSVTLVERPFSQ